MHLFVLKEMLYELLCSLDPVTQVSERHKIALHDMLWHQEVGSAYAYHHEGCRQSLLIWSIIQPQR